MLGSLRMIGSGGGQKGHLSGDEPCEAGEDKEKLP